LQTYRALLGRKAAKAVKKLEDDIQALMPKTEETGAAGKIREFWERAVSWFREEAGQAHVITEDTGETTQGAEKEAK